MSIFFSPDQWATLEIMAQNLLSGKVPLTGEKRLNVRGHDMSAVVTPLETSQGPVTVVFLTPVSNTPSIEFLRRRFLLTPKEAEVAVLMCEGRSSKEIARLMGFKVSTAEKHAENVLSKMGVGSRKDVLGAVMRLAS